MPYITRETRAAVDAAIEAADVRLPGELNYAISRLVHRYLQRETITYARLNEVLGVLEAAKLELYRTVVAPYEEAKRREHGGVSDLDTLP
jgi:hypothetical protein